jgi:hypothetical protein
MAEGVHDYLTAITKQTGDGYALFISKSQLERENWAEVQRETGHEDTWDDYEDVVLVDSTLNSPEIPEDFVPDEIVEEAKSLGYVTTNSSIYSAGVFPVLNAVGEPVGQVFVERDLTEIAATLRRVQVGLVTSFLLLALSAAAASFLLVERMVFRRLDGLLVRSEHAALSAAAGDRDAVLARPESPKDEFGEFERFFTSLMAMIAGVVRSDERPPEDSDDPDSDQRP